MRYPFLGANEHDRENIIVQRSIFISYPIIIAVTMSEMSTVYVDMVGELIKRLSVDDI